jgi:hypothetical protein
MDIATCVEDGQTYFATQFAQLDPAELERKRRQLICSECHNPAFFRKESRDGKGACFGARPHVDGCSLAVEDSGLPVPGFGDEQDGLTNFGNRIVVDLDFGATAPIEHVDQDPDAPRRPRSGPYTGGDGLGTANMHKRLRPLLRLLVEAPNFQYSDQIVEVANQPEMVVRDFFVQCSLAGFSQFNQFRGFWGQLTDARNGAKGQLWLNSGGKGDMSFFLPLEHQKVVMERFGIENKEEFAGAYILVLGTLRVSQSGKMICFIEDPAMMTLL